LLSWKEATLIGTVFVDTAQACAIALRFEKRTFENELATSAATVTLTPSQRKAGYDLFLFEVRSYETTQLSLGLSGAEFCVLNLAGTKSLLQSLFK
jgi:hypothetical protein